MSAVSEVSAVVPPFVECTPVLEGSPVVACTAPVLLGAPR